MGDVMVRLEDVSKEFVLRHTRSMKEALVWLIKGRKGDLSAKFKALDGVAALEFGLHAEAIPFAVEIHSHSAFIDWLELGLLLMDNLERAVFASESV